MVDSVAKGISVVWQIESLLAKFWNEKLLKPYSKSDLQSKARSLNPVSVRSPWRMTTISETLSLVAVATMQLAAASVYPVFAPVAYW